MNQYIITEEELSNMIFGEIKGRCADRLRQFTADKIRSRPYNPREGMVWMTSEEEETRIRQAERETVLDELKRDLKTRFVSSDSQWGRGRNSGLLECCNIIDEYLRQAGEP